MVWIVTDDKETEIDQAVIENGELWLSGDAALQATGWQIKPEGLCRDGICVPVPPGREAEFQREDTVNLTQFWRRMDRPVVHDQEQKSWMFAEGARDRGAALESLEAPDFTLPDLAGHSHSLSEHRGKKILLTTWASW